MTVTINQVAAEAGVSITTVSRVLNNNYPVRKETREKVEATIKRLNYKPNIMARGLITKKTSVIGVVVPGITNLFFSTIVESIENYLRASRYNIFLCNTAGEEEYKSVIDDIIARQVDGIIIIDPLINEDSNEFYENLNSSIPTIIINGDTSERNYNRVAYDEKSGAEEAFNYIYELGHERVLFIRGRQSLSYDIKEKVYREMAPKHGYCEILTVGGGNSIEVVEKTRMKFSRFIEEIGTPDAVFACNDLMALGVLNACIEKNISVPEQISITGFDNTMISDITKPKITTVDQNMELVAKTASEALLNKIKNKSNEKVNVILPTKLVCKESCMKR
ncbi:transcriptional regulator, LacI family [Hathewaya proteolytica DSM 3090]|uniref:Transcriptional regulator, LacI family n=1 Tax=Hathewaya proteolytica DSM 3090 TaxID=1121331 RepID=A0A1M6PGN0_9CLOT|nr:LacI family DNA-binding transcriptional regulator [Hathewaya proteolytica]SHK07062.1 transcriptional regulator, LacI family [Hathewaya proteolytica DSM 3090]